MTTGNVVLTLISIILGSGVIASIINWIRQRGREPIEQESLISSSNHTAIQSLQLSHKALHDDVQWLRDSLGVTRNELNETKIELDRTRTEFRRLRNAWSMWWEDLYEHWHSHRMRDEPPPRPDGDDL